MKTSILASAIALSLGLAGQANAFTATTIQFDINGAGAGGLTSVDVFDWLPGNALAVGALGEVGGVAPPSFFTTVYQAKLNSFIRNVGGSVSTASPLAGTEFTIQAAIQEFQTGVGTGTANFTVLGGWVKMFYDTTPDANDITGAGYGDGAMILSGTIDSGTGSFTDQTRANNAPLVGGLSLCNIAPAVAVGCTPVLLDQFGVDNQGGVLTHTGNGSSTVNVKVDFQDSNFFKSILTMLAIGLNDTTNLADPFKQANPSDQVVGETPSYSLVGPQMINGGDCARDQFGNFTQRCDFHFQTDGSTSFRAYVPEPGTLALLGLGLIGLGMMRRKLA